MAPWRGERKDSWSSNGNIAVYLFSVLFSCWLGFQIWARLGGQPAPPGLDAMVMTALGVAVTSKSMERREKEQALIEKLDKLEELATETHPEVAGAKGLKHDQP